MEHINQLNYLSIEILDKLGNASPSESQIELMELLISGVLTSHKVCFPECLTQEEIICLYWAAHGLSAAKTANLLKISFSEVESRRKTIMRKLSCKTMAQAVFRGITFMQQSYASQLSTT